MTTNLHARQDLAQRLLPHPGAVREGSDLTLRRALSELRPDEVHELRRRGGGYGLAAPCVGVGRAALFENVSGTE